MKIPLRLLLRKGGAKALRASGLVLALATLALGTLLAVAGRQRSRLASSGLGRSAIRFNVPAPERGNLRLALPALSPDGRRLAYGVEVGGVRRLYLRDLGSFKPVVLSGTDGALAPFFSPDGRELAFIAEARLKKMTLPTDGSAGSMPITLSQLDSEGGASWGDDGEIVLGIPSVGLVAIPENGGESRTLLKVRPQRGEDGYLWPEILPGGEAIAFTVMNFGPVPPSIAILDRRQSLVGQSPGSQSSGKDGAWTHGAVRTLIGHGSFPRYVHPATPGGAAHLLYVT